MKTPNATAEGRGGVVVANYTKDLRTLAEPSEVNQTSEARRSARGADGNTRHTNGMRPTPAL